MTRSLVRSAVTLLFLLAARTAAAQEPAVVTGRVTNFSSVYPCSSV